MYPVEYEVKIYNEFSENLLDKQETICGITFAENYTEAMENIEKFYGDNIIDVKLFMNEEQSIYELNPDPKYHEYGWFQIKDFEKLF